MNEDMNSKRKTCTRTMGILARFVAPYPKEGRAGVPILRMLSATLTLALLANGPTVIAAPRVELEVAGSSSQTAHEWGRALSKVPFSSVRFVGGDDGATAMELSGSAESGTYRIKGVIDSRNQLRLPGGATFRISDRTGMAEWIGALSTVRRQTDGTTRLAFDLSAEQLVSLNEALSGAVVESTLGRSAREVIQDIDRMVLPKIVIDARTSDLIPATEKVAEELSGLSAGTALAAVLRPLGLVVVPDANGGSVRLVVRSVREAKEHWPVGWPAESAAHEHVPKLHEFLKVEIDETPLSETVAALVERLDVPVLYDQNGMARQRIDPDKALVSFPLKRTFYSRILKHVLFQAKLKYEVRLDEAERPFLWISPNR